MQQGGSQYGVSPEMTPFAGTGGGTRMLGGVSGGTDHLQKQEQKKLGDAMLTVEAAAPINSRPPADAVPRSTGNFEELEPESGGFPDEDVLAGEEVERGVTGGNRWPRQETVALLKIRSEMDVAFRDATLKGPLWEDVSRKLAELGYVRSAKKCKEKFENVHKYYKRTKEARAGRQDGKSYRFFSQLEALHTSSSSTTATTPTPIATTATNSAAVAPVSIGIGSSNAVPNSSGRIQPPTVSATPAAATNQIGIPQISPSTDLRTSMAPATGISGSATATTFSFSSNTSSSADSDLEGGVTFSTDSRKRKRGSSRGGSSTRRKMMSFFEGLMKQVMERQEAMQQRFLEAIEKREQDRMIREEAWKRQEMARLSREHEITAQERAISASRDSAIISFLQKITGQTIQLPQPITILAAPLPQSTTPTPPPPAPQPQQRKQQQQQQQPPPQHHHHQSQNSEIMRHHPASSEVVVAVPEHKQQQQLVPQEMSSGGGSFDPTSSRWPKAEVHALIKLRSGLESRYQEAGPKGPLWEEISAGMQRMGYNRSAKRCKEKWENINKYFKKVKESNKKRPEDAKTCPYFHQLEALHRKKILGGGGGSFGNQNSRQQQLQATMDPNPTTTKLADKSDVLAIMPPPPPMHISETENNNNKNGENTEVQTNKGLPSSLLEEGNRGAGGTGAATAVEKPEDIVTKLMEQQQQQSVMDDYDKMEEADSDNLDQEEDDEEDDDDDDEDEDTEEESKMAYKIQFQRQNAGSSNGGGNAAGSFLAIVQ